MEEYKDKTGLYEVRIEKAVSFTPSEGDAQSYLETETEYVWVKHFKNFLIYLHGVNTTPDVVGLTYRKIDDSVVVV